MAEDAQHDGYYKDLVESAPDAILVVNQQGTIELVNRQAELLFGYSRDELIGRAVEVLVPDRARDVHPSHRGRYFGDPRTRPMGAGLDLTARRKDGSEVPVDISLSPLQTERGMVVSVAIRDVTERKRGERALQDAYEKLSASVGELERHDRDMTLVNEMGDLLQSCVTTDEAHEVISRYGRRLFPSDAGAVFTAGASRTVLDAVATWGDQVRAPTTIDREECWALRRARAYVVEGADEGPVCPHLGFPPVAGSICVPMMAQGEAFGLFHVLAGPGANHSGPSAFEAKRRLALTVAEQLSLALANLGLRESLRRQSVSDPLTGLYNRRFMEEQLGREISRSERTGLPVAVVAADVDIFKDVNDGMGHGVGDEVLRAVAKVLEHGVREGDIVCRCGGDEFVVVMPSTDLATARARAEDLRTDLIALAQARDASLPLVTMSLGVAVYPEHGRTVAAVLRAADVALYQAKQGGRNQVASAGDPSLPLALG